MKTLIITITLGAACLSAFAQGTLNFANAAVGYQGKVTDWFGAGLSGNAWSADLYWAGGVVTDSTFLVPLNQPAAFKPGSSLVVHELFLRLPVSSPRRF